MYRISLPVLFILFFASAIGAQDQHFTQFYAAPLTLNPALTGAFGGKYRFTLNYRDQGNSPLNAPYTTYAGSVDMRFGLDSYKKSSRDAFAVGVVFFNDRSQDVNFFTNYMAVSGAYHKALSSAGDQFLSVGIQAGIAQRNVNYDAFTFDDQFNGSDGFTDPSDEFLPENNFSYGDYAFGLHYSYAPERRLGVYAGVGLFHFLEPEISFYANEEIEANIGSNTLFPKYVAHLGLSIPVGLNFQVLPRGLVYIQGPHRAANVGSNFRIQFSETTDAALQFGGWVRVLDNVDEGLLGFDTAVLMLGVEYENFLLGFSYDAKITQIRNGQNPQGALEFSVSYLGAFDNDTVLCPSF